SSHDRSDRAVEAKTQRHQCNSSRHVLNVRPPAVDCTVSVALTLSRERRRLVVFQESYWSPRTLRDVPFTFHQPKGALPMFTRTVEGTPKSGKVRELRSSVNERVVPILEKQTGFVSDALLVSVPDPTQV